MSTKSSSSQQERAKKKRQKELKRRTKKKAQILRKAGTGDGCDAPTRSQKDRKIDGDKDLSADARSRFGITPILDSLELNQKYQSLTNEIPEKPIERIVADKWWHEYMNSDGVGRLALTRKKLDRLPFDRQEDYFPDAVFELETKLPTDQYVGFLEEIEQQQVELFTENLSWFATSMIFFYLNHGKAEQLEHVVTVMAEKLQEVPETFFGIFSALRLAGHDRMASRLLNSAVNCLPNSELMYWAVDEINQWMWMDLLCDWLKQGSEPGQLDQILDRFPESLICEEENQDQHQASLEFYRDLGLRMAGEKQADWWRDELLSSAKGKQWDQLRMLSGQWINWLTKQHRLSPGTASEFRRLLFSATSKLADKANSKPFQVLLNGIDPFHFDEVLATSFHFMNLAQFEAPATIVVFQYLFDYFMELDLLKKNVRDRTCETLDKLEKDVSRITEGQFGFLPRYQNN